MTSAYLLLEKRDECTVRDIRAHQERMIEEHERKAEIMDAIAEATADPEAKRIAYEMKNERLNAASRIRFAIAMTMTSVPYEELREADREAVRARQADERPWTAGHDEF